VFALTFNRKASFLQGTHRIQVINARKLGHG
jgi:hypothetical protein